MKCICDMKQGKNFGLLALRLAFGVVFIYHGWLKLNGIDATATFFESLSIPIPVFFAYFAGLLEFLGGIALILGFQTKTFAGLLAIEMIIALLIFHTKVPYDVATELPIALLGGLIALHALGAGEWRVTKKECVHEFGKKK
ncbi:DoxX family protein [Patescibacteria group bacterium]|nr:DoxX family protein [Patescibacteria group bacterium]